MSETSEPPLPSTFVPGWSNESTVRRIPFRKLGQTNMSISLISFGAAHVGNGVILDAQGQLINAEQSIQAIREAIKMGINLIDTSPFYGMGVSEMVVGRALKTVPRKAYFVATKFGRHPDCTFDYSAQACRQSVMNSLQTLNLDYIDLLHIHDVEFCPSQRVLLQETLPVLDQFRREGKIRYIGITGYSLKLLKEVLERSESECGIKIDCILTYCRHTLWDMELRDYLPYFKSKNVGVINAAIFGMGLLNPDKPLPDWHPAPAHIRQLCSKAQSYLKQATDGDDDQITLCRLALRHSLMEPGIHTHLIGMETVEMVHQNLHTMFQMIQNPDNPSDAESKESKILDSILKNVFGHQDGDHPAGDGRHWENIELKRYQDDPRKFIQFLRECWQSTLGSDHSKS